MKILVAENNVTGLKQLTQMLELDRHDVLPARTWSEAQASFAMLQPELVLLNPVLPDADGYACVAEVKRMRPDHFVPVILAATVADHLNLERFLASGADDFIDLPYNHMVLKAKIAGFERVNELYHRLEKFRSVTEQEIKLAKHMFDAVINRKPDESPSIHHWSLAAGHFCGDLMIFERTPDNRLHIMLGDFTGHGLAAAVGALPTSEVFFSMTRKGDGISEIAREINLKLHRLLPTGQFCAASLVNIALDPLSIEVWNAGLPPILLVDEHRMVQHRFPSNKLPLGILDAAHFDGATSVLPVADACHVILYSDGLVEAQNAAGETFGDHGLANALLTRCASCTLTHLIKAAVIEFLDGLEPHDDISMLTVNLATLS